jgi:hypothetical protein
MPDRLAFLRRELGGLLTTKPRIRFLLVLLLTQGLFPLPLELAGHQTIFRFDGTVRPCRPLRAVVRPL